MIHPALYCSESSLPLLILPVNCNYYGTINGRQSPVVPQVPEELLRAKVPEGLLSDAGVLSGAYSLLLWKSQVYHLSLPVEQLPGVFPGLR